MQGHSAMDISKVHELISTFYGYQSSIIHVLWISLDFYGYALKRHASLGREGIKFDQ